MNNIQINKNYIIVELYYSIIKAYLIEYKFKL
jgi:hypothetical protein